MIPHIQAHFTMYPPSSIDLLGIVDDQSLEHRNNVPEDSE
jgi:hypothetical protein